jgi:CheY-like chemotaxis protein
VAILGHADVALRDPADGERVQSCLEGIKRASIRASDLAAQLLSYTGKNEFELNPGSLNRLIEEMTQLVHASISRKVDLQLELADDLPAVDMDPTQIRQVVLNLITNAAESIGDEPGRVCVRTGLTIAEMPDAESSDRRCVELAISDTGCGMDEETLEQIFEPFFSTKVGGRGLGMAAVQGIVARHRGALEADSTPGEGTTFRIVFPASSRAAEQPTQPAGHTPAPSSKTCRTVLVIDDEEDVREILQMMLESTGLVVLTAADGPEGIETFREQRNHVAAVLLDMTMPRMNGVEVLAEIRRIDEDVPVLLCSGYGPQNAPGEVPLDQIAGFIAKPFEMDNLLETVFAVLEKSSPDARQEEQSPNQHQRSAG